MSNKSSFIALLILAFAASANFAVMVYDIMTGNANSAMITAFLGLMCLFVFITVLVFPVNEEKNEEKKEEKDEEKE